LGSDDSGEEFPTVEEAGVSYFLVSVSFIRASRDPGYKMWLYERLEDEIPKLN